MAIFTPQLRWWGHAMILVVEDLVTGWLNQNYRYRVSGSRSWDDQCWAINAASAVKGGCHVFSDPSRIEGIWTVDIVRALVGHPVKGWAALSYKWHIYSVGEKPRLSWGVTVALFFTFFLLGRSKLCTSVSMQICTLLFWVVSLNSY